MSSASTPLSIGIDFGTTNTVVAIAAPDGRVETITFAHGGETLGLYVTALAFIDEGGRRGGVTRVEGGPWAIEQFLETTFPHRFIQSFKSFAASASFQETRIFRERLRFEEVAFRPLRLPAPRPAELHLALRRDGDDPLIARLIAILAALPWRPQRDDLDLIVRDALAWERILGERKLAERAA